MHVFKRISLVLALVASVSAFAASEAPKAPARQLAPRTSLLPRAVGQGTPNCATVTQALAAFKNDLNRVYGADASAFNTYSRYIFQWGVWFDSNVGAVIVPGLSSGFYDTAHDMAGFATNIRSNLDIYNSQLSRLISDVAFCVRH